MRRSVAVESVSPPVSSVMTGTFQELPITDIHESALLTNPRATFDQDALDELAASIRLHLGVTGRPGMESYPIG